MLITDLLPQAAARDAAAIALVQGARRLSYGDLHRDAARLASALRARGLRAGDRIGIFGEPALELVVLVHAAVAIGAIPVGMFLTLGPAEIQAIVDDADFAAIVHDATHSALALRLTYARAPLAIDHASLAGMIAQHAPLVDRHRPVPDDIALVIYTGATTGRPKGVVHTHRSIATWYGMTGARAPAARTLLFNLAHISGMNTILSSAANGSCTVLLDRYPPTIEELVDVIERERITNFGAVPTVVREIVRVPGVERRDFSALKSVLIGGAPISPQMLLRAADVFRPAIVLHAYGLTESGNDISVLPVPLARRRPERLRSVGHPDMARLFGRPPFAVRIVDPDGRDVPAGEVGEIIARGEPTMVGYWNDPEATAAALDAGWLHTGDLGRFDADGYLYIVDRIRDVIVAVNAICVYSSEVELALERHPAIADAAVVGTPHDEYERITAFVVLHPGATLDLAELQRFCAEQIAAFKTPSDLVVVPQLPRTSAGKVDKVQLRALAASAPKA